MADDQPRIPPSDAMAEVAEVKAQTLKALRYFQRRLGDFNATVLAVRSEDVTLVVVTDSVLSDQISTLIARTQNRAGEYMRVQQIEPRDWALIDAERVDEGA